MGDRGGARLDRLDAGLTCGQPHRGGDQFFQFVDALRPARLHTGEHLRRNRNKTNCVTSQDERGLVVIFGEGDCGLALEQMLTLFVDRDYC